MLTIDQAYKRCSGCAYMRHGGYCTNMMVLRRSWTYLERIPKKRHIGEISQCPLCRKDEK